MRLANSKSPPSKCYGPTHKLLLKNTLSASERTTLLLQVPYAYHTGIGQQRRLCQRFVTTRSITVNTPDGFHEMDNPLFNYTFQTDAAGNGFPSGDPVSLHPSMKTTENVAKPRRLVDLPAPDGKFSMDRSALECWPIPKQQY